MMPHMLLSWFLLGPTLGVHKGQSRTRQSEMADLARRATRDLSQCRYYIPLHLDTNPESLRPFVPEIWPNNVFNLSATYDLDLWPKILKIFVSHGVPIRNMYAKFHNDRLRIGWDITLWIFCENTEGQSRIIGSSNRCVPYIMGKTDDVFKHALLGCVRSMINKTSEVHDEDISRLTKINFQEREVWSLDFSGWSPNIILLICFGNCHFDNNTSPKCVTSLWQDFSSLGNNTWMKLVPFCFVICSCSTLTI